MADYISCIDKTRTRVFTTNVSCETTYNIALFVILYLKIQWKKTIHNNWNPSKQSFHWCISCINERFILLFDYAIENTTYTQQNPISFNSSKIKVWVSLVCNTNVTIMKMKSCKMNAGVISKFCNKVRLWINKQVFVVSVFVHEAVPFLRNEYIHVCYRYLSETYSNYNGTDPKTELFTAVTHDGVPLYQQRWECFLTVRNNYVEWYTALFFEISF